MRSKTAGFPPECRRRSQTCCIVDGHVGEFVDGLYTLNEVPYPECEAVLVRQTISTHHSANDNLRGSAKYGFPGPENNFSFKFDDWEFDTFIFATKDHQHFLAMTKEAIGGSLVTPRLEFNF